MEPVRRLSFALFAGLAAIAMTGCDPEKMAGEEKEPAPVAEKPKEQPKPSEPLPPLKEAPTEGDEVAVLETGKGTIVLMFYPERAPKHVENFKELVRSGFYDGVRFHRCIPGFVIQAGDPYSKDLDRAADWGTGGNMVDGKEKTIPLESNDINHKRGVLSMARGNDPNSASSQFFIMHGDRNSLNRQYTGFGKVVSGMEAVDQIVMTPTKDDNGTVFPSYAVVLKKATIQKWPLTK